MIRLAAALAAAVLLTSALAPAPAAAFSGFGSLSAHSTYGQAITFDATLSGGMPDRLELLLQFAGSSATFVAPVTPTGSTAEYVWDTSTSYVTPNTTITYRWRATTGDRETVSGARTFVYADDRPGLDWHSAQIGQATVHWYGSEEAQARTFGQLSAGGAQRAEQLLGHQLDGPIDIFVYDTRDDFFGALGPGAREWTGAATYPEIRTVFMWLGGGPQSYLETTIVHEVTHVVFADATDNPYHSPAAWFNEGLARWSEQQSAASDRATVRFEAASGGLFAFPAIAEQFPISSRGSSLAYAMGATMVDDIITTYGRDAIARIAAAYRDGASDAEALQAGTGKPATDLYTAFYAEFGVSEPAPVQPAPIPPSNVRLPGAAAAPSDGAAPSAAASAQPSPTPASGGGDDLAAVLVVAVLIGVGLFAAWRVMRRADLGDAP